MSICSLYLRALGIALALMVAGPAATAQALVAPEILYREGVSETEATGPWLPLDGARINGLGFILGTRAQAKPPLDSAVFYRLTAVAVPDGRADQSVFDPASACLSSAQAPGTEIVLTVFRYEGPGSYTIRIEANVPSNGATPSSCSGGPSSTATFIIDPTVSLSLLSTKPVLVSGEPFDEVAKVASLPAGSAGETQCARDGVTQPDGSIDGADRTRILGPAVHVRDISRAGRWTCVGRARDTTGDGTHYTRWSAPVSFDAISAFQATFTLPDKRRPRYTLSFAKMPPGSEGGRVSLRIAAGKGCPRVAPRTMRATVDGRLRVRFTFRLPEKDKADLEHGRGGVDGYGWLFRFTFSGTKLVRPARSSLGGFLFPKRHQYGGTLGFAGGPENARCIRTI